MTNTPSSSRSTLDRLGDSYIHHNPSNLLISLWLLCAYATLQRRVNRQVNGCRERVIITPLQRSPPRPESQFQLPQILHAARGSVNGQWLRLQGSPPMEPLILPTWRLHESIQPCPIGTGRRRERSQAVYARIRLMPATASRVIPAIPGVVDTIKPRGL